MRFISTLILLFFAFIISTSAQNTAISLDGVSTYVSTTAYPVPASGDFTVEFWALLPSLGSGLREFLSQGGSGTGFYIGTDASTQNIRGGDAWQNTGVHAPIGRWFHVALVNTAGTAHLFLDGKDAASTTGYSIGAGGDPFTIGRQFSSFGEYSNGTVEELRVWNVARTALQIKQGLYGTVSTSSTGLVAYYKMNEGTGTTLGNSTATAGQDGTLVNSPAWVYSPIQGGPNSVNFDGSDDQINAPHTSAFDISTGTVEAWINPSSLSGTNSCIFANRDAAGTNWSFHVSSTQLGFWNGSAFQTMDYIVPTGTWTHLAFVSDGTQTFVYANGSLVVPTAGVNPFPQGFGTTGHDVNIGISISAGAPMEAYNGYIDEVRIWNTQRSQAEILSTKDVQLTGTETGLNALYSFNQGNADNANTNLVTVIDQTSNGSNAQMINFALTGLTSNWSSVQSPLPVNFLAFTATRQGENALLQWNTAQEQNSSEFIVERSTNGTSYTAIGTVAAAGNSNSPLSYSFTDIAPLKGLNYYRLKEKDLDGKFMYSTVKTVVFATTAAQKLVWFSSGSKAVEVDLQQGSNELFSITDMSGRLQQKGQLASGKLYLTQLPAGVYNVKVFTFTGQRLNAKILVQ